MVKPLLRSLPKHIYLRNRARPFIAQITRNRTAIYLGSFTSVPEAKKTVAQFLAKEPTNASV